MHQQNISHVEATMLSAIRLVFLPGSHVFASVYRFFRSLLFVGRMSIEDLPDGLLRDVGLEKDWMIADHREADRLLSNRRPYRPRTRSS